jgi:hypothetical protein
MDRFLWSLDLAARLSAGHRVLMHDQVEEAREALRARSAEREAARQVAEDVAAFAPPRVTRGSPYEVVGAVDAALHAYGLPPTSGRGAAGSCAMVWREIGSADGPTSPCTAAADYLADLGYRGGTRLPVCSGHAHQLVTRHRSVEGLPMPTLRPMRPGVSHGLPTEYLGSPL